jgi:cytoskeletal protein RodZ
MGPVYNAICVSENPKPEPRPYWKSHQRPLFVALLLIICILVATIIGVFVSIGATNDPMNSQQQLAEQAVEYDVSTETASNTVDPAGKESESTIILAPSQSTPQAHEVTESSLQQTESTPLPVSKPSTSSPSPSPTSSLLSSNLGETPLAWLTAHNTRRQYYNETVYGTSYIPLVWSESLASDAQSLAEEQHD